MRPGMEWPRSLFACFALESLFFSSVYVNPILILACGPRARLSVLGGLRRRRRAELHGYLRATPHLGPSLRVLFNSKIASNHQRLEPEMQTHLGDFAHRLAGKIGHGDVAALVGSHGDFRSVRLGFGLSLVGPHGRQIGLPGEIRWGKILKRGGFTGDLALVRGLNQSWVQRHVTRHIEIRQYLLGDTLEARTPALPPFFPPPRRLQRNHN